MTTTTSGNGGTNTRKTTTTTATTTTTIITAIAMAMMIGDDIDGGRETVMTMTITTIGNENTERDGGETTDIGNEENTRRTKKTAITITTE